MYQPTSWEEKEIERLSEKEPDEPAFVTRAREHMIELIKEGKMNQILYDEWGEVYYPVDPDSHD